MEPVDVTHWMDALDTLDEEDIANIAVKLLDGKAVETSIPEESWAIALLCTINEWDYEHKFANGIHQFRRVGE